VNASQYIENRRRKVERRGNASTAQFPIITTQGICIRHDRRYTPERRISGIIVKEWRVKDSTFELLFQEKEKQINN